MRDKLPVTFFVLILLASCAAPPPTAEIASPTPAWTPTPDAGIYPFPSLESNIILSSAPGTETIEDPTLPTTLAELNLTESGGGDAQVAESLRAILAYDSDGDGKNDRNGYDDRWGVIVANLWVNGQLGEGIETFDEAAKVAKDMFGDVPTINGERWSVQPRNIATGEIGVAYDPETGLPYPSGMSFSGDWTSFETRFFPSPAGGGEQIVVGDSDEESFTLVAKDEKTGKPRWVLVNGKWREDAKWRGELIQEQYWLNPDGTTKPGEVIPAGCLQSEGKDHCVLNPEASPAVYEGLLKMIYNVTVSFGGNPGGYWDKSGDWAEREARLPQAAEEFVQACRDGQTFDNLTNLVRWGGKRPSEGGGASMGLVYAEPFGTTIDCRNIQVVILTPEQMRAGWAQDELQGFWSTNGDVWFAKFEAVPMDDGSGNSRIQFVIGRLEDKSDTISFDKLKPGVTPESFFANLGIYRLITALDPENGTLSIRSETHDVKKKTISLWGQSANMDPKIIQARGEEALTAYFDEYWDGGLVEGE